MIAFDVSVQWDVADDRLEFTTWQELYFKIYVASSPELASSGDEMNAACRSSPTVYSMQETPKLQIDQDIEDKTDMEVSVWYFLLLILADDACLSSLNALMRASLYWACYRFVGNTTTIHNVPIHSFSFD